MNHLLRLELRWFSLARQISNDLVMKYEYELVEAVDRVRVSFKQLSSA